MKVVKIWKLWEDSGPGTPLVREWREWRWGPITEERTTETLWSWLEHSNTCGVFRVQCEDGRNLTWTVEPRSLAIARHVVGQELERLPETPSV